MDLLIPIDRALPRPLRDQLYHGLRGAVLDGRLRPGARLPATRALARELGLSRFTVEDAYNRLIADGYLTGRHGSGTYVAHGHERDGLPARDVPASATTPPARRWSAWADRLSGPETQAGATPPAEISFRHGVPSLAEFPLPVWRRLQARATRGATPATHAYGPVAGYPPLQRAIAAYLARSRMLRCEPDQVLITSGAQQALDLLARLFLDPGDGIVLEEPCYPSARRLFGASGATLIPVPVDADGLRVDLLETLDVSAKLLYVTPSHQFPTGGVLPLPRRQALLAWARRTGTLIVEDDYDGEFRYGQRPVEALAALDAATGALGAVAYVGTFSKVLYPALRLGYLVLPPDLVDRFVAAKDAADRQAPTIDQATLAAFIDEGHFERHLARMRRVYAARLDAVLAALARHFGDIVRRDPASTAAGLHILVQFELPLSEREVIARAAAAGIHLDPASPAYAVPPPRPSVLLGYATLDERQIETGIARLAKALLA